jgi:hypothetical protein
LRDAVLGRRPGKAPPADDIAEQFQRFELHGGEEKLNSPLKTIPAIAGSTE